MYPLHSKYKWGKIKHNYSAKHNIQFTVPKILKKKSLKKSHFKSVELL